MSTADANLPPEALHADLETIRGAVTSVIVGQTELIDTLLTSLLCQGHSLLIGVPGLAKTLSVRTLANALEMSFNRIQFTPDLLPSDITGSEILEGDVGGGRRAFRFEPGPVFANLVLADEINRTPPRTQSALLEAMQEREVSAGGTTHALPDPFLVLATQNPIEQEGTFPLPEAQLDRFFFAIELDYPDAQEETAIVRQTTGGDMPAVQPVATPETVRRLQAAVPALHAPDEVVETAVALVRASRPGAHSHELIRQYVAWGAGPRASQVLILGAKARAFLHGRDTAGYEDLLAMLPLVLRHRIVLNFSAERDGIKTGDILDAITASVEVAV